MRVVREVKVRGSPGLGLNWHVEHDGKVLNTFRTRAKARKAIKDSGELAEKLTPCLDFVNCRGE